MYSEGLSEEITGKAMRNSGRARTDIVLATKVMGTVGKGVNDRGASRGHIMDGVKASLKRLGTDYIDLYQIHGFDPLTPIEETVRALDDLVRQGHVRYVGLRGDQHKAGPGERLHCATSVEALCDTLRSLAAWT